MGLLSKLLGKAGEEAAEKLTGALKDLTDIAAERISDATGDAADRLQNAARDAKEKLSDYWEGTDSGSYESGQGAPAPASYDAPESYAGLSYGPYMPAEENQFNYPGTYDQYFMELFRSEFSPAYGISASRDPREYGNEAYAVTFTRGGATALIVELVSEHSQRKMLRESCASRGIPYLRFYYDHEGWWNTRSYVLGRVHRALGA